MTNKPDGKAASITKFSSDISDVDKIQNQTGFMFRAWTELILLFVILPLMYLFDLIPVHKIVPLIILFFYCLAVLIVNKRISAKNFQLRASWKSIVLRFIVIGAAIFLLLLIFSERPLLADLLENRKLLYMLIMYPLLSAFPQELIFREFFFYRYEMIFRHPALMIVVNVVLFAFAHIYFASWIVIIFTLIGGLIFATTYLRTKSLIVVTIEHTLYGLLILSTALSEYFYKAF